MVVLPLSLLRLLFVFFGGGVKMQGVFDTDNGKKSICCAD